ncbi:MAG: hypothetical protein J6T00_04470 [Bacteroidaceae bacterium]|jgi:hypothetical protein|nr:hypothetical protein [Bacteroidaceae bacterium]
MIELYLSKVTESSETEQAGKLYARVSYKQAMTIQDMARHMAEHNTVFSEGSILGVLTDFVKCVREMVLMGNTVKIENLAIFKDDVCGGCQPSFCGNENNWRFILYFSWFALPLQSNL